MLKTVEPIKKISVVEQAIERIYDLIQENEFTIGDHLPTERVLAESLGISRSSLREALRVLDMMGIIKVQQGRGTILATAPLAKCLETPPSFALLLNRSRLLELLEVRTIIEVESAGLAAERSTEEDIDRLNHLFSELLLHQHNREKGIECEIELHNQISACAHNDVLEIILSPVKRLLIESRDSTVPLSGVSNKTVELQRQLIAAVKDKDSGTARSIMREHLEDVNMRLLQITDKEEDIK